MSFFVGYKCPFFSFGGFTALSRLRYCSLLCFSSQLLGYFSFAQRVEPRLGCFRFFSRVFGVVFHGWTADHRPQLWVALPRLHLRPRRFFFYRVRLLSSKLILYLILPSEFQLSYRCYCSLYSTFLFKTLQLDTFLCVCL